jgi:DNA ligase (NAD+)
MILAERFGSLDKLVNATEEELRGLHEVGPVMAASVAGYFRQPMGRRLIEKFRQVGVDPVEVARAAGPLTGKIVVFTGTLTRLSRAEAERLVRELGGDATSTVSSQTSFVVSGAAAGSKLRKAQSLGIEVLNEDEFLRRVGR